jgi:hypothetical protein
VQQPRPPIWVAGMWPGSRRPFARAARWDGVVPVSAEGEPLLPKAVAEIVALVGRTPGDGFDLVTARHWDAAAPEYEAVGATWLVEGAWPEQDWYADLRDRVAAGPPRA